MSTGEGFVAGGLAVTAVALIHNVAKNAEHKQQLDQMWYQGYEYCKQQMTPRVEQLSDLLWRKDLTIAAKDTEIAQVKNVKDAEIGRLNGVVENLAKALKLSQLQNTAPILSLGNGHDGDSQLN